MIELSITSQLCVLQCTIMSIVDSHSYLTLRLDLLIIKQTNVLPYVPGQMDIRSTYLHTYSYVEENTIRITNGFVRRPSYPNHRQLALHRRREFPNVFWPFLFDSNSNEVCVDVQCSLCPPSAHSTRSTHCFTLCVETPNHENRLIHQHLH